VLETVEKAHARNKVAREASKKEFERLNQDKEIVKKQNEEVMREKT
jgi:hypothetical protein